jgi:hypothetical protein
MRYPVLFQISGQVPTKSSWKSLVKASIYQFQLQSSRQGLNIKPERIDRKRIIVGQFTGPIEFKYLC